MIACPHCGTQNLETADFCSQCGTRLGTPPPASAGPPGAGATLAPLASGCVGVVGGVFVGFALAMGAVGLAGTKTHAIGMLAQAVVLLIGAVALVWVIRAGRAPTSPLHASVLFAFLVGGLVTTLGAFSLCSGIFLENPSLWEKPQPQFTVSPLFHATPNLPAAHTPTPSALRLKSQLTASPLPRFTPQGPAGRTH